MDKNLGSVGLEFTIDDGPFAKASKRIGEDLRGLKEQLTESARTARVAEQTFSTMGSGFRGTILTIGALRFALMDLDDAFLRLPKSVIATTAEFQRMEATMKGLSQRSDEFQKSLEAKEGMSTILDKVKTAPFEMKALTDSYIKFKSAGLDPLATGWGTLIDAVAKFGGNSEVLKRASVAIQQMAGKGVISMEELRQQLGEAVPSAMAAMARGMGLSMAELSKKVSSGSVEATHAIAKMMVQLQLESAGAAQAMMDTLPGALEKLSSSWELYKKQIGEGGLDTVITKASRDLSDFMSSSQGKELADSIGKGFASAAEEAIVFGKALRDNADVLKIVGELMLTMYAGGKVAAAVDSINQRIKERQALMEKERKDQISAVQGEINALEKQNNAWRDGIKQRTQQMEVLDKTQRANHEANLKRLNEQVSADREAIASGKDRLAQIESERAAINKQIAGVLNPQRAALLGGQEPTVSQFDPSAAREQIIALNNEADMIERTNEKRRESIKLNNAQARVTRGRIADITAESAALASEVGAMERNVQANERAIAAKQGLIVKLGQVTTAVKAFGMSLAMSTVYTAAAYLAIEGLIWLYDKLTGSAKRAEEAQTRALRIKSGQADKEDAKKQAEELADKQKELADINEKIAYREKNGMTARAPNGAPGYYDELKAKRDKLQAEVDAGNALLRKAKEDIARNDLTAEVTEMLSEAERQVKSAVDSSSAVSDSRKLLAGTKESELKGAALEDFRKKNKEYRDAAAQIAVDTMQGIYDKANAKLQSDGSKATEAQKLYVTELGKRLIEQKNQLKLVMEDGPEMAGKGAKGKKGPVNELEKYIAQQTEAATKINAKAESMMDGVRTAEDVMAEARKVVDQMAQDGRLDKVVNGKQVAPDSADKERATKATYAKMLAEGAQEALNALIKIGPQLDDQASKLQRSIMGTDVMSSGESNFIKFADSIKQSEPLLRAQFKALGKDYDDFMKTVSGKYAEIDLLTQTKALQDQAREMEISNITDEKARTKAEADYKIEQLRRVYLATLEYYKKTLPDGPEKDAKVTAANEQYARWMTSFGQSLSNSMKTPVDTMLDQWAKGFQQMQQLAATTADNMVDAMVDGIVSGNWKLKDVLQSFGTDVLKIQLKQGLANTMSSIPTGSGDGGVMSSLASYFGFGRSNQALGGAKVTAEGALMVKNVDDLRGALGQAPDAQSPQGMLFDKVKSEFSDFTSWLGSEGNAMGGQMDKVKESFGGFMFDLLDGLDTMFTQIAQSSIGQTIGSWASTAMTFASSFFANGGIMTPRGSVPLKAYKNGGVANSPQVAVYGEGDMNEAYVPLPDGRTIPVTVSGGAGGAAQQAPSVHMNVINQTGVQANAKQTSSRWDGKQMILDVVLEGMATPGNFRDSMKNLK